MPGRSITRRSERGLSKTALLVALAVGLVGLGIIVLAFRAPEPVEPTENDSTSELRRPTLTGGEDPDSLSSVGGAQAARITLIDKDDPSRTAWDIEVDGFDPIENTELVFTENPRGWIYLDESRPAYFRADEATFRIEALGQEPESGEFVGSVEILLFDVPAAEADIDRPAVRIETESLVFDTLRGELTTPHEVRILTPKLRATLQGLRAVVGEQERVVERIESQGGGEIVLLGGAPAVAAISELDAGAWGGFAHVARRSQDGEQPEAPRESFYDGLITRNVRLTQGERVITGERLTLAGRLIDGGLAPDAVREVASAPASLAETIAMLAIAQSSGRAASRDERDVRLSWDGPLEIDRVRARPEMLGRDELAARFEATVPEPVRFEDPDLEVSGSSETLRYGLSTSAVRLTGSARHPLRAVAEGTGALAARDVEMNLATGVGVIRGAGTLTATDQTGRAIEWAEQADFLLSAADDEGVRRLETASFASGVRLRDARLDVRGDSLKTEFDARAEGATALRRAIVRGDAVANSGRGTLAADEIDVAFEDAGGEQPVPKSVFATGSVRGERDDAVLTGASLEATLESVVNQAGGVGDPEVRLAIVRGNENERARFERADGVFAMGDELRARAIEGVTEVIGEPAMVGSESGRVTAGAITLRQEQDEIEVIGAGTFERLTDGVESAEAVWTRSMNYAGVDGRLEIRGDARLSASRGELSSDTLQADTVVAFFEQDAAGLGLEAGDGEVNLRTVDARGSVETPAVYEAVRRPAAGAKPDRLMLLEGSVIEADNTRATLDVPVAGRLLVADLREDEAATDSEDLEARGAALFTWGGSMSLDRAASEIVMRRDVSMVRRQPGGGADATTQIRGEKLTATIRDENANAALSERPSDATLERVLAEGAVWMRRGVRELTADLVDYAAAARTARAESPQSGWVTLFDAGEGRDLNAEAIVWDLGADRIEVVRPQPVAAPN